VQHRHAETGAGRHHGTVRQRTAGAAPRVEHAHVRALESGGPFGGGFQIVDQRDVGDAQRPLHLACVHAPGQVGRLDMALDDGTGDAGAQSAHAPAGNLEALQKVGDDGREALMIGTVVSCPVDQQRYPLRRSPVGR
jgi:hypothetical protein